MTAIRGTALLLLTLLAALVFTFSTLPSDGAARAQQQATPTPNCLAGAVTDETNTGLMSDCVALLTARDTLRGTASLNWAESTPIGTWNGITLTTATPQRVSRLDLRNRGLNGTIPPVLGSLGELTRLYLQANSLSGSIPPSLGDLENLTLLSLWGNDLSGSIPPELGNLTNLTLGMSLRDNDLSGSIPPSLGDLENLTTLYLNNNDLSGSIPPSLGDLENLTTLYLWGNDLTGGIPPELGDLENLEYLSLSRNDLSGSIPTSLGNLTNLLELYLNQNNLSGSIPSELGDLEDLTTLYLWGNRLTGSIPSSLGELASLRNLSLSRNDLSGNIPSALGDLARLRTLYLNNNRLSGSIPTSLGSLTNLEELSLSRNDLSGSIPSELGSLTDLRFLHLNNNQLSGSIPPELGELDDLEILTLERNSLSGAIPWSDLQHLGDLQILYLNDNNMTGSIGTAVGSIVDLQELRLDNNQLSGETPLDLGALEELTLLDISNNRLEGELSSWMPDLMDSLNTLVFHSNSGLCAPTDAEFQTWLDGVETVQGSSCADEDHSPGDREVLETFYAATDGANWAKNTDWNGDELMRWWHGVATDADGRVTGLFLSGNQLRGPVPPELGDLAELRYLYLDHNDLSGAIPRRLGRLAELRHLYLDENGLTGEIPGELGDLPPVLTDLRFAGNELTGCVPMGLHTLVEETLGLPRCFRLEADSPTPLEIEDTRVDNEFELVDSAEQTTVYISIPQGAVETGATLAVSIPDAPVPPADFTLPAVPRYVEINLERDDGDEPALQEPVTVCLPRISGVPGEQRVIHLGDGPNARWTALDEPDTYPDGYPASRFICGVATEFSIFTVVISTPPSVLGTALILRIEPNIRSVTLSAGDQVRLSVDVYGRQNILDNRLADDIEFDWDDDADGSFSGDGREVIYTAPDSPGSYTVTVGFANAFDCEANREGSKCSAEFEIRVRRPSPAPSPTPAPENPPGDIPTLLVDSEGRQYDVFTPVDGGTHDPGEGFSITAGPGVVPNGEIVGISMSRGGAASNVGQAHHRYTLAGDSYDILAVDGSGQKIADYRLASPAQACIPLSDILRANISDVAIAATGESGSQTILASSVRITPEGAILCGNLSELPATVAAAKVGAPPDFPTPTPVHEEELPDTGGSGPRSSSALLWMLLVGIAAAIIGATVVRARRRLHS